MVRRSRRSSRPEHGAAAVEFALVSIPLMVLILGMIQYGWYFYVAQTAGGAASTVARRLAVGDCWTSGQALTLAKHQAPTMSAVTLSPTSLSGQTVGTTITVTYTANASILNFVPMPNNGVRTGTVVSRLEDTNSSGAC